MGAIEDLIERMRSMLADLERADDLRRHFHATYFRTTVAVKEEIERGGFLDPVWVERWDVAFADLYLDAMEEWDRTGDAPGPWRIAFTAARDGTPDRPRLPPLRHVLLGINAHVNYDLPQALLAVIGDDEFDDPAVSERRAADHAKVDDILVRRVAAEDVELQKVEQPGDRTVLDRLMQPFNRAGTKRFLAEARRKVWHNARELSSARRGGDTDLARRLGALEELSRARVADLVEPRFVILRLARHGFGVELPAVP